MKKQAITLGRVGILLPIAGLIPFIGFIPGLAAMILLLFSHHYFSKVYGSPDIFKNALIGTIVPVVANIVGGIIIAIAVGSAAFSLSPEEMESGNIQKMTSLIFESGITIFAAIIILAGTIIGFYYIFQSLKILAEKSGVNYFRTAGLLYFVGAIGIVVFFIGFLVMLAAWIIHIIAYFTIQPEESVTEQNV